MIGVYINFNNPFGKHLIGTSDSVEGACTLVRDMTNTKEVISPNEITAALRVTEHYYKELENGMWFVIQETIHKHKIIRRVPING